jgi:hypothetical protein
MSIKTCEVCARCRPCRVIARRHNICATCWKDARENWFIHQTLSCWRLEEFRAWLRFVAKLLGVKKNI